MPQIIAVVDQEGKIHIETKGYIGEACMKATEELLRKLKDLGVDASTTGVTKTPDYYKQPVQALVRERA